MKKALPLFIALFIVNFGFHCSNTPSVKEQTVEKVKVQPNKKRDKAPVIKVLREYKISPTDTVGFLTKETFYNEKGLEVKSQSYDFTGTGEMFGSSTSQYNDKGQCIKNITVFEKGTEVTTYLYKYDEGGMKTEETWSRPNGQRGKKQWVNKDGKVIEEKTFDDNCKYVGSSLTKFKKDEKGRLKSEICLGTSVFSSDTSKDAQTDYTYFENDSIKETIYDNGAVHTRTENKYDAAGNRVEEKKYEGDKVSEITQTWNNEYGEYVLDSLWKGNKESFQYRNIYRYDKYGNRLFHMYSHQDGEAWGERMEIEYYL